MLVGIFDTPQSPRNPHDVRQRAAMFLKAFPQEITDGRLTLMELPWVDEVAYGRDCGWRTRRVHLDAETEAVSGTAIRAERTHA